MRCTPRAFSSQRYAVRGTGCRPTNCSSWPTAVAVNKADAAPTAIYLWHGVRLHVSWHRYRLVSFPFYGTRDLNWSPAAVMAHRRCGSRWTLRLLRRNNGLRGPFYPLFLTSEQLRHSTAQGCSHKGREHVVLCMELDWRLGQRVFSRTTPAIGSRGQGVVWVRHLTEMRANPSPDGSGTQCNNAG